VPKSDWNTNENSAKWQKMYQEMRDSPPYKKAMAEYEQTKEDLKKYVDAATSGVDAPAAAHGYVWLFRRGDCASILRTPNLKDAAEGLAPPA